MCLSTLLSITGTLTYLLTYLITYLLTPWCRVLLYKLTGLQLVKKFPAFHGTRRFITALTSVRHLSLSWASPIQSIHTSYLLEIRPNIIHPSTPRSLQWHPSLRFPHQDPIHPLSSPIRVTCPAHLILLDFITRTKLGEEYKSFSSSLCNLLHSPVTSSLLGPNILLNYRYTVYFITPLWRFVSRVYIMKFCFLSQTRYLFYSFIIVFTSLFINFLHKSQLFRMITYYGI